jgi:hypothetical protein
MSKNKTRKPKNTITVQQLAQSPATKKKTGRKNAEVDATAAYRFVSEGTTADPNKNRFPYLDKIISRVKSKLPVTWSKRVTQMAHKFEQKHLAHRSFYKSRIRPLWQNIR